MSDAKDKAVSQHERLITEAKETVGKLVLNQQRVDTDEALASTIRKMAAHLSGGIGADANTTSVVLGNDHLSSKEKTRVEHLEQRATRMTKKGRDAAAIGNDAGASEFVHEAAVDTTIADGIREMAIEIDEPADCIRSNSIRNSLKGKETEMDTNVELIVEATDTAIPNESVSQPLLAVTTHVTNQGTEPIEVDAAEFQFKLFKSGGPPIGKLSIGRVVVEGDSRVVTIKPGTTALVKTNLKFVPQAVNTSDAYEIRLNAFGQQASAEMRFTAMS